MHRVQIIVQTISALLYNSYLKAFFLGTLYQGKAKSFLCPGFNCHSCPGALFTCPIGAIQFFASNIQYFISFYVLGFLGTIGVAAGRIVCGWACPFGLVQDLLNKIPSPKFSISAFTEKARYLILFVGVLGVAYYTKEPWFCKLCPVGTLEAGIPLVLSNADIRGLAGNMFIIKLVILFLFIIWMILSKRPFCRVVCPLGTIYSFFNRFSIIGIEFDQNKCYGCNLCFKECPVEIKVYAGDIDSPQCIRCFRCVRSCPSGAIKIKKSF